MNTIERIMARKMYRDTLFKLQQANGVKNDCREKLKTANICLSCLPNGNAAAAMVRTATKALEEPEEAVTVAFIEHRKAENNLCYGDYDIINDEDQGIFHTARWP